MCDPPAKWEIIVRRPLTANCMEFVIVIFVPCICPQREEKKETRKLVSNVERDFYGILRLYACLVHVYQQLFIASFRCLVFLSFLETSKVLYMLL